jgi:hypothetical protein
VIVHIRLHGEIKRDESEGGWISKIDCVFDNPFAVVWDGRSMTAEADLSRYSFSVRQEIAFGWRPGAFIDHLLAMVLKSVSLSMPTS